MTAMTLTLTDFLLARIADDEEAGTAGEGWNMPDSQADVPVQFWDYRETHIGYRRFLAECDAKRQIAAEHAQGIGGLFIEGISGGCHTCLDPHYPCRTLKILALPYADHEDFRDEWRP